LTEKEAIYHELLVLRCKQGQKCAFEELIRMWEQRLFYYIRRIVDDEQEAWQILQETWVKVLRGIWKLREPRKAPSWLYSIARTTSMSYLRAEYARQAFLKNDKNTPNFVDYDQVNSFDDAEQVHYGLGRISLPHREVLTLFFLQDLSIEEIGEVLRVPVGTVKSRLYYAKRALKGVLEKEQYDNE
jgi:RNA polymerase sigma-70 factor (ECF subfamily)